MGASVLEVKSDIFLPIRRVTKGECLFEADQQADTAYLVREGVVIVGCSSPNGREVITSIYFPGEVCGGIAVLTGCRYLGTARAPRMNEAVVTPLRRRDLLAMIEEDPQFYHQLIVTSRDKQRFKDRMLLGMVAESCRQRTAAALLWLHGRAGGLSKSYLCRQELADLVGSTVETVIRVLSEFRKNGLLEEEKDTVRVDVIGLSQLAASA